MLLIFYSVSVKKYLNIEVKMGIIRKIFNKFTDEIIAIAIIIYLISVFVIYALGTIYVLIIAGFIAISPMIVQWIIEPVTLLIKKARKRILGNDSSLSGN
jgi:biotin transporter BioY